MGVMAGLEGHLDTNEDASGWMVLVWTLVVFFGAVGAASLALPSMPAYLDNTVPARALFHPEWLVMSTLLVLPLQRVALTSWRSGLVVVPIACAHVIYIADTAVDRLHQADLRSELYAGWYVVAFVQVAIFVVVGARAARIDFRDRRWVRRMRIHAALPAPQRNRGVDGVQPAPPLPPSQHRRPGSGYAS